MKRFYATRQCLFLYFYFLFGLKDGLVFIIIIKIITIIIIIIIGEPHVDLPNTNSWLRSDIKGETEDSLRPGNTGLASGGG